MLVTPYFGILMGATALSVGASTLIWKRRKNRAGTVLSILMLAVAWWTFVAGMEAAAVKQSAKILFSTLEYVGSGGTAVLLLMFSLYYVNRSISRRAFVALWVGPIINLIIVATNAWHGLVWTGFTAGSPGSNLIIYHHGPLFFLIMAVLLCYVLAATIILVRAALSASVLRRRQTATLLVAALPPWISTFMYIWGLDPIPGLNIVPTSFAITGLVLMFVLLGSQWFNLVPFARDILIESMSDAVLVIDAKRTIVDVNPAARRLLGPLGVPIGATTDVMLARWPALMRICRGNNISEGEVLLEQDPPRYVDVRITPLADEVGQVSGQIVVLRDITARYHAERNLQQANRRLQAQLDEIEALKSRLQEQAVRDPLTGVFNRRFLTETLPREEARAKRSQRPITVFMTDINRFKEINDRFGHQTGDTVLQEVASLLLTQIRQGDFVVRYGGDEFLIVLPENAAETDELKARIERALQSESRISDLVGFPITLSMGTAHWYPNTRKSIDQVIDEADRNMYQSKQAHSHEST